MDKIAIIEKLKRNKERTPEYSAFSDNNHEAIDAMIEVVDRGLTEDEIYKQYNSSYVQDAALSVLEFMRGEIELEDILFPEDD